MNGVRRTVTTRGESEKKPRGRDTTRLGKTRERCGEDTIRAVSLPTVPSSPRRLLSSSPRFLRTGGKEKRRISDERRRDDEGRDGPRVVHSCLRHFRSLTRPFPPSLSSLRRSVPHALVRSSRRSLGSSLPPERRDGRMTGRSEGGKEPRTTVRPLRVSLSRSVRTSLTSPSETRSAHFARSCLRREW